MTQSTTLSAPLRLLVRLPLWQQILIGLALGVAAGMAFGADAQLLAPIGTLFLNAIKMLIVPLVFVSLVAGITSMQGSAKRPWMTQLLARKKPKVAAVALANKNARIIWAMMATGEPYRETALAAA